MTAGSFVTQSRGAFLGLIAVGAVLVWKLGRSARFKAVLIAGTVGVVVMVLASGNYGLRILSIFIPSLDPVGSSGQRTELLIRSIIVSLRNPLGIGIGNFEMVGVFNLGTHNAYTQVSSELGLLAFAAYVVFLLWPVRKLDLMEKQLFNSGDRSWIYYLSIGIQASIERPVGRDRLRFGITASNLLNTAYRDILDRFRYYADARGTDLVVWVRYGFGKAR